MVYNQQGGILSKLIYIPLGVVLMVGFFFLGYYVGKYQSKSGVSAEIAPPLPEIASSAAQKQEEFTFYKTLTDRNDKTISIDLKPRTVTEENRTEKQQPAAEAQKSMPVPSAPKEKRIEINFGKEAVPSARSNQVASKQPQQPATRGPAVSTNVKARYTVQTASYQERAQAEDEVKRLKRRGFAAFIVSSELPGKGVRHRVRIGSFSNRAAAEKLQTAIHEKERILTIVVSE
ncbi:MAG: SPOR domain-containing protein [Nitrospirae bacterium]|nr:SPOR domain-containing protein [Nitrospirota bacterium]